MPWTLLWLDVDLLFDDRPRRELAIARRALRSGVRTELVEALDLVGVHNARSHDIEEEDLITALQCTLLGDEATGELAEIWAARTSRAKARACPSPQAAALLRVAGAWAAGQDEPAWIYNLLASGEGAWSRRGDICGVLSQAQGDLEFERRYHD